MKFTKRDIRALALFMPLMVVLVWVAASSLRPQPKNNADQAEEFSTSAEGLSVPIESDTLCLHAFDPNVATFEELRAMGLDKFVARNIVKYRTAGRTYAIPEDVAVVYGVTDSLYELLKPHIAIGNEFTIKAKEFSDKSNSSTHDFTHKERKFRKISFDPNALDAEGFYALGCFTARQAEALVEHRQRIGGFASLLQFRDCYLIGEALFAEMRDYIALSPLPEQPKALIDINTADSLALISLRGIGPTTAHDIIAYRQRLGGFHSKEQLFDLAVVQQQNYELFEQEIWCDSCKIRKIDINFVAPKELAEHPYMTPPRVRKIIKHRQLKGGWSTTEEFMAEKIVSEEEAARILPYLKFSPIE